MMAPVGAVRRAICSGVARHCSRGVLKERGVLGSFGYERPSTIDEALTLLAECNPGALVLAGGTDLFVDVRAGRASPRLLVDVKRIDALRRLVVDVEGGVSIGAAVTLNELLENRRVREVLPGLCEAAASIATYPLRNRATAVGNLCNASPAADLAPILLALGASIVVHGDQERTLPLPQFVVGVKRTAMRAHELATRVLVPPPASGLRSTFLKQQRLRGHDLAVASVAGTYDPGTGRMQIAFGSCAPTPVLVAPIEAKGNVAERAGEDVARRVLAAAAPISDVRASADYRRAVLSVLARRVVTNLLEGGSP